MPVQLLPRAKYWVVSNYSSKHTVMNQSAFPGTLCNKKEFMAAAELLRKLER